MPLFLDSQSLTLSDFADVAQVIIAIINLYFVGYLLLWQIRKDSKDKDDKEKSDKEKLRLVWFKELVVHPNLIDFFKFFDDVSANCESLKSGLSDEQKGQVIEKIKGRQSLLRKQFVDLL